MTEQSSAITEVEQAARREAEAIATNILTFAFSPQAAEGSEGPEGSEGYDGPFPNNPAVKGHPEVQAALMDLVRKGTLGRLFGLCWGHANERDGGLLAALRQLGYKV
ncbi:hypothetical protein IU450_38285 [Nocardia abscessus]|uniref:hypothetical protein n=1 Tax=Nocardia abscessus TaxID=120957 RepID=UPI0018954949|nr:hypothetical protein [Nocardia abscessus]MBF6341687.1 hypothetical protein [Nocardia abscessus]